MKSDERDVIYEAAILGSYLRASARFAGTACSSLRDGADKSSPPSGFRPADAKETLQ